jgi:periplasmic copper chaperone A
MHRTRRLVALAVAGVVLLAAPAAAHVTANPSEATRGGFAKIAFRVPNERDDAGTVRVEIQLPAEHPIENVSVRPVPGWEADVTDTVITWTGGPIEPGQFQEFDVSLGPLPDDADELVFKALQTYSSGEVVRWIEEPSEGGEEPDHPAPVVRLVEGEAAHEHGGADDTTSTTSEPAGEEETDPGDGELSADQIAAVKDDADSAKTLGLAGIVVGALGVLVGAAGLLRARREVVDPAPTREP